MSRAIILDSGPLGRLAHPKRNPEIAEWYGNLLRNGATIVIPEIADYEVRRSLLLHELGQSVARLAELKSVLEYMPLDTQTMLDAAGLWAIARKDGLPTADPKELDCDVILAAQASRLGGIVATENVGHLSRFVEAKSWRDIT